MTEKVTCSRQEILIGFEVMRIPSRKLKSEFDAGCQGKVVRLAVPRISSCVFQQDRIRIARSILVWNLLAFQCITIV